MGGGEPVGADPGERGPDPRLRMADPVRTFWFRQMLAAVVFFGGWFLISQVVPRSWPRGVQALFLLIPLGLSIWTLFLFRKRDKKREVASSI